VNAPHTGAGRLIAFAAAVAAVVLVAVAGIYGASQWLLDRRHDDVPATPFAGLAAPDATDLAEGERLAVIVGCWAGCHGARGEGGSDDHPGWYELTAPTLSDVLPAYSDAELVRLIRYGIKRDGRSTLGMIARSFHPLGDADLARIIAHLRRQPASPPVSRERHVTLAGRLALLSGALRTSADEVDRSMPRWGELPQDTPFARGRYLVTLTCTDCHGMDLRGLDYLHSPPLDVVAAYDAAAFRHLLRTGEALGGRQLGLMGWVARDAFSHFTDEEIDAIHVYLNQRRRGAQEPGRAPALQGMEDNL
jgi:cytochrome c553